MPPGDGTTRLCRAPRVAPVVAYRGRDVLRLRVLDEIQDHPREGLRLLI